MKPIVPLLFGLLFFAVSCSQVRLAYNYADWLATYKLDDYFDTNREQDRFTKESVHRFSKWHSQSELPNYQSLLQKLQKEIQENKESIDFDYYFDQYDIRKITLMQQVIPPSARFLATVDADQLNHFKEELEEENEEVEEELSQPLEERREVQLESTLELVDDWFGEVTEEQEKMIQTFLQTLPLYAKKRMAFRKRRQEEFFEFMTQKPTVPELQQYLIDTWILKKGPDHEGYREVWNEAKVKFRAFLPLLYPTLTPDQREHFLEELHDLEEDVVILIKESAEER